MSNRVLSPRELLYQLLWSRMTKVLYQTEFGRNLLMDVMLDYVKEKDLYYEDMGLIVSDSVLNQIFQRDVMTKRQYRELVKLRIREITENIHMLSNFLI